jgi:hypothetical protein
MLMAQAQLSVENKVLITETIDEVIHDAPIIETNSAPVVEPVVSVEIPTYKKIIKKALPLIMPAKKKPSSELKRKVSLNPLSN